MTSWPIVPWPARVPTPPASYAVQAASPCLAEQTSALASDAIEHDRGAVLRGTGHFVRDETALRLPKALRALQATVVYGCTHVAWATPAAAVFFDLQMPVGPSMLNPVGRVNTDAPLYGLMCLILGNGVVAPLVAQGMLRSISAPKMLLMTRARQRQSALLHGSLGAMVALMMAAMFCARLREEMAWRGASTGWENNAYPNSYYWQALSVSAHACLPLAALLGFYATGHLRAIQLLRPHQEAGIELQDLGP